MKLKVCSKNNFAIFIPLKLNLKIESKQHVLILQLKRTSCVNLMMSWRMKKLSKKSLIWLLGSPWDLMNTLQVYSRNLGMLWEKMFAISSKTYGIIPARLRRLTKLNWVLFQRMSFQIRLVNLDLVHYVMQFIKHLAKL